MCQIQTQMNQGNQTGWLTLCPGSLIKTLRVRARARLKPFLSHFSDLDTVAPGSSWT